MINSRTPVPILQLVNFHPSFIKVFLFQSVLSKTYFLFVKNANITDTTQAIIVLGIFGIDNIL